MKTLEWHDSRESAREKERETESRTDRQTARYKDIDNAKLVYSIIITCTNKVIQLHRSILTIYRDVIK